MIVALTSVEHTGTRFVRKILQRHGLSSCGTQPVHDPGYLFTHLTAAVYHMVVQWGRMYPLVAPVRHPRHCASTWRYHGKPLDRMFGMWARLFELCEAVDVILIPVDAPGVRDECLDRLSNRIGIELATDWQPVGSVGSVGELSPAERERIDAMLDDKAAFFEQFYPEPLPYREVA